MQELDEKCENAYKIAYKKINRCRNLNQKINGLIERKEELFTMATKTNCALSGDRIQTSGSGDKTARLMCEIVDLETEITEKIDLLCDMKEELKEEIFQCSEGKVRTVLLNRYVFFKSQKAVSKMFRPHLTVRRIQQLQEEGVTNYLEYIQQYQGFEC